MKKGTVALLLSVTIFSIFLASSAFGGLKSLKIYDLTPMQDQRRLFAMAMGTDGNIYVFGGVGCGTVLSSVERYDPATQTWTFLNPMPGAKAWQSAATASNGLIYLFGGSTDSTPSTDVWAYNPSTDTWNTSLPPMPMAERDTVAVTGKDGLIYLFGGYWNYNTVQAFNPSTNTWQIKSPMPTGRWAAAGGLGRDGNIYIVGGGYPGQPDYGVYNTLEMYNPKTDTWTTKSPMPTARNYLAAAFGRDGKLYAIGGEVYGSGRTGIVYDKIESYDPVTDTWLSLRGIGVGITELSAVTNRKGDIHIVGGETLGAVNSSFCYDTRLHLKLMPK
jgi:N-acetylneuraminic acid mutarotase